MDVSESAKQGSFTTAAQFLHVVEGVCSAFDETLLTFAIIVEPEVEDFSAHVDVQAFDATFFTNALVIRCGRKQTTEFYSQNNTRSILLTA